MKTLIVAFVVLAVTSSALGKHITLLMLSEPEIGVHTIIYVVFHMALGQIFNKTQFSSSSSSSWLNTTGKRMAYF